MTKDKYPVDSENSSSKNERLPTGIGTILDFNSKKLEPIVFSSTLEPYVPDEEDLEMQAPPPKVPTPPTVVYISYLKFSIGKHVVTDDGYVGFLF